MLRMKLREECKKAWNIRDKFWQSSLASLSYIEMNPIGPFLYGEMMVIWFSKGIQEVKWLSNLKYP
jgi:hypothetical protein